MSGDGGANTESTLLGIRRRRIVNRADRCGNARIHGRCGGARSKGNGAVCDHYIRGQKPRGGRSHGGDWRRSKDTVCGKE